MSFIFNSWYPLCFFEELEKQNPLPKKILGKNLLIFRNNKGEIGVLEDRCCHRNVQLSLGSPHGEGIRCAYHGWTYNIHGKCVDIPSLPKDKDIPTACKVISYPLRLDYNIVWVWLGDPAKKDEFALPPMPEMHHMPRVFNYHYFKGDLMQVAESLIDAYHINHVHKNSIQGIMGHLHEGQVDFNLNLSENALTGTYLRMNEGSIFEKFYFGFQPYITTHFGFWFPHTSKLDIAFPKRRMVIYEFFYPVDEAQICLIQITLWENIFAIFPAFARNFMARKSEKIVEEDLVFLENSYALKQENQYKDLLVSPSDEVSLAFIKLWKNNISTHEGC